MPTVYWTRERILEAFTVWEKKHGSLPTSTDWKYSPATKNHPTARWVARVFGSWSAAIAEYQDPHRPAAKKKRWKIWTQEEIVEAFQKWNEEEGRPPKYNDVTRGDHNGRLPSMTSIGGRFGSFRAAMLAAGFEPLPTGVTYKNLEKYKPLPRRSER